MIFAQDLTCFAILWSHLFCACLNLRNVPSGKFLHGSRLCKSYLVTLQCLVFMSKTLLCIAQQPGPFKSCSYVLLSYSPSLLLLGLYPSHFNHKAKAWESMYSYLRKNSKNLNFLILYRFWNSTCILWVPFS